MCPNSDGPVLQGIEPTFFPESVAAPRLAPDARFVRNTWYVAMFASELDEGKLVHRTIMNHPIVFYRKEDGGIAAIIDRCPHRFVPLSMGTLLAGDKVQCIYHGLQFGADGKCALNPHGSGKVSSTLDLRSFPVVEKHTLIWIWMGEKPADLDKIPDYSCLDNRPELHVTRPGYIKVKAHYHLLVDNLRLEFGASRVGEPKESGTGYFALHFLTPETERTTHYHYTASRWNVLTDDERNREIRDLIYKMRTFAFAEQDVPVVEAQQVSIDHGGEELAPALLSVDAGPNRYQKVLDQLMAEEA